MANPFDQFDSSGGQGGNPFDKFDAPLATAAQQAVEPEDDRSLLREAGDLGIDVVQGIATGTTLPFKIGEMAQDAIYGEELGTSSPITSMNLLHDMALMGLESLRSDYSKQQKQHEFVKEDPDSLLGFEIVDTPNLEQVKGAVAQSLGPGAIIGQTAKNVSKELVKKGVNKKAADAAGMAAANTGFVAPQTYDDAKAEAFQYYLAQGITPEEASQKAIDAAQTATSLMVPVTVVTGGIGGMALGTGGGRVMRTVKGAGIEAVPEGAEEAAQSAVTDIGIGRDIDPVQAAQNAILGSVAGVTQGGVFANIGREGTPRTPRNVSDIPLPDAGMGSFSESGAPMTMEEVAEVLALPSPTYYGTDTGQVSTDPAQFEGSDLGLTPDVREAQRKRKAYEDSQPVQMTPEEAAEILALPAPTYYGTQEGDLSTDPAKLDRSDLGLTPDVREAQRKRDIRTEADAIFTGLLEQESGGQQFDESGKPKTSKAGAIGIAQVMPKTAPEAAQLAGLPWDENRYKNDADYNRALGKAYFDRQVEQWGDIDLALTAYNWGPGNLQHHIDKVGDPRKGKISTQEFLSSIPVKEAREYASSVRKKAGMQDSERTSAVPEDKLPDIPETKVPATSQPEQASLLDALTEEKTETKAEPEEAPVQYRTSDIVRVSPEDVQVDAKTFQFKEGGDEFGVTDALRDVKEFDRNLADPITIYEYKNGERFVVDGHQRLGLAKRAIAAGQEPFDLDARIIRQEDGISPEEATVTAAYKNIAQGTGTKVDAAKVFRRFRGEGAELPPFSRTNALARDGDSLAALNDTVFGAVVNEVISPEAGASIGEYAKTDAEQEAALRVLSKVKPDNRFQADQIVRDVVAQGVTTQTQNTLFGDEQIADSLYLERARVLDRAMKGLSSDKKLMKTLVDREGEIEQGGNVLNKQGNQAGLSETENVIAQVSALANRKGEISDALSDAAKSVKEGTSLTKAVNQFKKAVREAVQGRGVQGDGRGRDGKTEPEKPATTETQKPEVKTEQTEAGEQTVIKGAEKAPDKAVVEQKSEGRKKASVPQKPPGSDGGLFDTDAGKQLNLSNSTPLESDSDKKSSKSEVSKPKSEAKKESTQKIEDFGEKIGGARKDIWKERNLLSSDLKDFGDRELASVVRKNRIFPVPDYEALSAEGDAYWEDALSSEEKGKIRSKARQDVSLGATFAYLVKRVRDSIQNPVNGWNRQKMEDYVDGVGRIRDALLSADSMDDYTNLLQRAFGSDIVVRKTQYGRPSLNKDAKGYKPLVALGSKFLKNAQLSPYDFSDAAYRVEHTGFPRKKEAWENTFKVIKGDEFRVSAGKRRTEGEWKDFYSLYNQGVRHSRYDTREEAVAEQRKIADRYFLLNIKNREVVGDADARDPLVEKAREALKRKRKRDKITRPQFVGVTRAGLPDWRKGKDITGDMLMEEFGFRGGEFGNWTTDDDRQQSLNFAYEALHDLANTLNIPPKAISLNGTLGIAFGARGKTAAAAHYEPGTVVINLTKLRGAGALAHEWAHAMDDYFGRKGAGAKTDFSTASENFASYGLKETDKVRAEIARAWNNVVSTIVEKSATSEETVKVIEPQISRHRKNAESWLKQPKKGFDAKADANQKKRWDSLVQSMLEEPGDAMWIQSPRSKFNGRHTFKALEELNDLHKSVVGRNILKKNLDSTSSNLNALRGALDRKQKAVAGELIQKTKTDFKREALKGDSGKSKRYWSTVHEMFARAFEAYVQDKIATDGSKSEYLVAGADNIMYSPELGLPYPEGVEREQINSAFDSLFSEIRSREKNGNVELYSIGRLPRAERITPANAERAMAEAERMYDQSTDPIERQNLREYMDKASARAIEALEQRFTYQYSSPFINRKDEVARKVYEAAKRMNPKVKVKLVEQLFGEGDALIRSGAPSAEKKEVSGSYSPQRNLITVSLNGVDPEGAAFHEAWHSIERMLTDKEQQVLGRAFPGTADLSHDEQAAYAFQEWATDKVSTEPTVVRRIFTKIKKFLQSIGNALRGAGFNSVEDIFESAYEGDIGGRDILTDDVTPDDKVQYSTDYKPKANQLKAEAAQRAKEGGNAVAQFWKRNMTKEGFLGKQGKKRQLEMESIRNVDEFDIQTMVASFENDIEAVYGKPHIKLSDEQQASLRGYLAGDKDANVPAAIKPRLDHMRDFLDRASSRMQDAMRELVELQISELSENQRDAANEFLDTNGKSGKLPVGIENQLAMLEKIESNKGQYLNRSYQAFDDPKWMDKVLKEKSVIADAEAFIAEQNPNYSPEEVTGAVRAILRRAQDNTDMSGFMMSSGKVGKKEVSMLKKRKDVPPQIRALLGEYRDAKTNFVKSADKMSRYLAGHYFNMRLREDGLGTFLFERPTGLFDTQVAAENSDVYNPLNGLYTTKEFVTGMKDAVERVRGPWWLEKLIVANSSIKYGKTILAPTTQARNFMSAAMFTVMNGHFDWSEIQTATKAIKNEFSRSEKDWNAYTRKLLQLGVLHDNPHSQELRLAIEDVAQNGLLESGGKARNFLDTIQKIYRSSDDFWKIVGFENEKKKLMERRGMSEAEAEVVAAERIRDGYPTYSMVPRAIRGLRHFPFVGTFVSFPWEIIRTTKNQIQFMREDMEAGATDMAAQRAAGMAIAMASAHTLSQISMMLMGLDEEDDEAIRGLSPEWQKNAQLMYLGYDEDGLPKYMDLSHLDPYAYLKKPITALLNGNNAGITKKLSDAFVEMASPFVGPEIGATAVGEVVFNSKLNGGQVYNPQDKTYNQVADILSHLKNIAPGFVSNIERMSDAMMGNVSKGGRQYKLEDETLALIGFRLSTLNIPQSLIYKGFEFQDMKRNSTRILSGVVSSPQRVTDGEIKTAYDDMLYARDQAYDQMLKNISAAKKLGVKDKDIALSLRASKVGKEDIGFMMREKKPFWKPSRQFLRDARDRAVQSAPSEERKSELRSAFAKRVRTVNKLTGEAIRSERLKNDKKPVKNNKEEVLRNVRESDPDLYPLIKSLPHLNNRTADLYQGVLSGE